MNESIGILSYHFISALHSGHAERPTITCWLLGMRKMQTLAKLPKQSPAKKTMNKAKIKLMTNPQN